MSDLKLSKRLSAAASFVRDGAVCADIGTDHAYIPISLVLDGKVKYAIASDINEGPILKARENIEKYGLADKITARIADGLNGIEEYKPNSIVICGMGGELIARIINDCAYVKQQGIQLILQPMTSIAELREYLSTDSKFMMRILYLMRISFTRLFAQNMMARSIHTQAQTLKSVK